MKSVKSHDNHHDITLCRYQIEQITITLTKRNISNVCSLCTTDLTSARSFFSHNWLKYSFLQWPCSIMQHQSVLLMIICMHLLYICINMMISTTQFTLQHPESSVVLFLCLSIWTNNFPCIRKKFKRFHEQPVLQVKYVWHRLVAQRIESDVYLCATCCRELVLTV